MTSFEKTNLANGLTLMVNTDTSTPLVAMNILYKVGARDEDETKTGFAHLFEHLMFGGSINIPSYDEPLQKAGGENNAFTNNDFTNYYLTIPKQNIETAFWLESDRMLSLAFSEKSLEVQRSVVIEEFRQRYLNQPYGDVWLHLRPLAYKVHPYKWATIGKEIAHIENATMDDVKNFFGKYYAPDNAILTLSGNIEMQEALEYCDKWFLPIVGKNVVPKKLLVEPRQTIERKITLKRKVPVDSLYIAFHTCSRFDKEFYATELMSDVLSGGKSSRLYQSLVKERQIFTDVHAYFLGDMDKSLIVVEGKIVKGVAIEKAEGEIWIELEKIKSQKIIERELNKVKQKSESANAFGEMSIANRALNLSYFEMLGDARLINKQIEFYNAVSADDIQKIANEVFQKSNSSTIYYLTEK